MFRFHGKIEFEDGRIEEFEAGNAALAAWERYAMRHKLPMGEASPPTMSSLVIAHHALGVEQGVDAWMESVVSIELDAGDTEEAPAAGAAAVPPTLREASPG